MTSSSTTGSLWEFLYTTAVQDFPYSDYQQTHDLYTRAQDAVEYGAFIFPNGTLCVHTVHQLHQLCWNDTIDVKDTSFFQYVWGSEPSSWIAGGGGGGDPSWDELGIALFHILSSLCLVWYLYRNIVHPLCIIPLVQWAHAKADESVLASFTLQQVHLVYACIFRRGGCCRCCSRTSRQHVPDSAETNDESGAPPNVPSASFVNTTEVDHGRPPSPLLVNTNGPTTTTDSSLLNKVDDEEYEFLRRQEEDHNEIEDDDNEDDDDDDDDTRPVFTITIDSNHKDITKETIDQLLKAINEIPPPLSQTTLDETDGLVNAPTIDDHRRSHTNSMYTNTHDSEEDIFRSTFRNPIFPIHWTSKLPPPETLPETFKTTRSAAMPGADELCCYLRPYLSTVNVIGRKQDLDVMWTGAMQPPSKEASSTHISTFPLHKRAVLKYTPHNPVIEKRWYHTMCPSYPEGYYERMLEYHSRYSQMDQRAAEYYVGGHIAILIKGPHESRYGEFLEQQWRQGQTQFRGGRLYITFSPTVAAVQDPKQLATELNAHIDKIIERTLDMDAANGY